MRDHLVEWLEELRISPADLVAGRRTPWEVWLLLHNRWGHRVTPVDLYDLEATRRGIAIEELPAEDRRTLAQSTQPVSFPGFQVVPGSAGRGEPVAISPYDEAWPGRYEQWREAIATALGDAALRIEHVGSTAVPGLAAKPVMDVQVSVVELEDEAGYVPAIEGVGVELVSREDTRRYFRPPAGRPRAVHVHVCAAGGAWEREHLLFRDYLRTHDDARDAYADLKRELAVRWRDDSMAYTAEKTAFILDTLEAAERWARDTGWTVGPAAST